VGSAGISSAELAERLQALSQGDQTC